MSTIRPYCSFGHTQAILGWAVRRSGGSLEPVNDGGFLISRDHRSPNFRVTIQLSFWDKKILVAYNLLWEACSHQTRWTWVKRARNYQWRDLRNGFQNWDLVEGSLGASNSQMQHWIFPQIVEGSWMSDTRECLPGFNFNRLFDRCTNLPRNTLHKFIEVESRFYRQCETMVWTPPSFPEDTIGQCLNKSIHQIHHWSTAMVLVHDHKDLREVLKDKTKITNTVRFHLLFSPWRQSSVHWALDHFKMIFENMIFFLTF